LFCCFGFLSLFSC